MILVDRQIRELVEAQELGANFDADQIEPATYDLRIGPKILDPESPGEEIDMSNNGGSHRLRPYGTVVLETLEDLDLPPNIAGRIGLKSGLARLGMIASTGPQIDPGFKGKLFVSLFNMTAAAHILSFRDSFLTIEFHRLEEQPEQTYQGPYQDKYSPSADVLDSLTRLEGLTLFQMQSRFSELLQRIESLTKEMTQITELVATMERHTEAVNRLADKAEASDTGSPTTLRELSVEDATTEILRLFEARGAVSYSEIIEELQLDIRTVIAACNQLVESGLIEEDALTEGEAKNGS